MALIDSFNRANEDPIVGYTKLDGQGNIAISGNIAVASGGAALVVHDATLLQANQEVSFKIIAVAATFTAALVLRSTGNTYYRVALFDNSPWSIQFQRVISGTSENIGSPMPLATPQANDIFSARVSGNQITAALNAVSVSTTDGNIASGQRIGFELAGTWTADDFSGGNYSPLGLQVSSLFVSRIRAA